jgi:hypothetical protein
MAAHRKPRRLVPLVAALCVLVGAAVGGYALTGSSAPETVNLASASAASGQHVAVTACLTPGKLTRVSVAAAPRCPAKSAPVHWIAQSGPSAASGRHVAVYACLASGKLTRISVAAAPRCPAKSTPVRWAVWSGPSAASGQRVTVYACLASGKLTRVSVAAAPRCPAKSVLVRWVAQSGPASSPSPMPRPSSSSSPSPSSPPSLVPTTTSPSTVPTTTSPSPVPTTASPSPVPSTTSPSPVRTTTSPSPTQTSTSPASWAWCSSAPFGQSNTPDGRFDLYNNEWNTSANPGPQTICGNSESDWQVTSTQRAGNTEVLTYPSVQLNYNGGNGYPLSKFTSMTSSYAETMHAVSGTDAEAAYDIWLNGLNKEVMIWVDNHGQAPAGSKVATTTFSGATWDLYETSDRSYLAFVRQGNASSGTVDLLAALKYLQGRGDLAASDVLWQVNFGWEICSTAGAPETFTVSNYSLTSAPSS